jgi:hypothetical protein
MIVFNRLAGLHVASRHSIRCDHHVGRAMGRTKKFSQTAMAVNPCCPIFTQKQAYLPRKLSRPSKQRDRQRCQPGIYC